ncbi:hypothetical protein [Nostoc parmelioides]|uniref:Uncharacterized protein n=1 Tax=Nostoc parmelioides FACHB-3921 TaxID=2692909 RepID=A0ABR8BJ70_9NOSO|nr:hypothetical protein [Nostoc parmelioides]MBD2253589.1 hypothetical protein [Nostoc parmelioides FACHB-3921]
MLKYSKLLLALIGIFCIFNYSEIQSTQAQVAAKAKLTYKDEFDRHTSFVDENCVRPEKRRFEGLEYELCRLEDIPTRVSIEGPEGENGATAYFYGGKLFAFRDTGSGQAWMFQDGKLIAEVEVGVVAPEYNKITTQFSPKIRQEYTDRSIDSTRNMLKVFGFNFNL